MNIKSWVGSSLRFQLPMEYEKLKIIKIENGDL